MPESSSTRPGSRRRLLIRLAVIVLMLFLFSRLALWLVTLPRYVEVVSTLTVPEVRTSSGDIIISNAIAQERAATLGVSLHTYAQISIVLAVIVIGVNWVVGGLILWRNPDSWFALLTAFILMMTGSAPMREQQWVVQRGGVFSEISGAFWPLFFLWLYLFPNGKPVPRWTRWVAYGCTIIVMIDSVILGAYQGAELPASGTAALKAVDNVGIVAVFALVALAMGCQVYRYVRVSDAVERQQTKWFVFGLAILVAFLAVNAVFPRLVVLTGALGDLSLVVIPIAVGFAILRYRLWDIDVIIRRTTSYAVITLLLALIYFGSIVVFQNLFSRVTGQDSTVAVVLSTLLIAGLFNPVRRRVQDAIDRRFNRTRYDAEKTLERFAATARDETDLNALTAELLAVIQETMQPASLSLWIHEPGRGTDQSSHSAIQLEDGSGNK